MKLKITEKGFEHMNGPIAEVMFVDGVSVGDVSEHQAQRIAAAMRCETLEGVNPSTAAALLRSMDDRAPVVAEMERGVEGEAPKAIVEVAAPVVPVVTTTYTREELEGVADKAGIKGLREIAKPFGVKGTSIKELIDEVLKEQAKAVVTE